MTAPAKVALLEMYEKLAQLPNWASARDITEEVRVPLRLVIVCACKVCFYVCVAVCVGDEMGDSMHCALRAVCHSMP